jgi:hypothetical protein
LRSGGITPMPPAVPGDSFERYTSLRTGLSAGCAGLLMDDSTIAAPLACM